MGGKDDVDEADSGTDFTNKVYERKWRAPLVTVGWYNKCLNKILGPLAILAIPIITLFTTAQRVSLVTVG